MTTEEHDAITNLGCVFPGSCVIGGDHQQQDCHTPEMAEWFTEECKKLHDECLQCGE